MEGDMNYKETIKEWWKENKHLVVDTINGYERRSRYVKVPIEVDGVIDYVEYDYETGKFKIYAIVSDSKEVWEAGWNDTAVYCDKTKEVLVLEDTV